MALVYLQQGWCLKKKALTLMMYEMAVRSTYVQGTPSAERVSASCLPSTPGSESTTMTRNDPLFTRCADTKMLSTKDDLRDEKRVTLVCITCIEIDKHRTKPTRSYWLLRKAALHELTLRVKSALRSWTECMGNAEGNVENAMDERWTSVLSHFYRNHGKSETLHLHVNQRWLKEIKLWYQST